MLQVSLGFNLDYMLGYIYFDQPSVLSVEAIIGIVIAILVVIAAVTTALLCYRRKQMKLRRQIERAGFEDFDLIPYREYLMQSLGHYDLNILSVILVCCDVLYVPSLLSKCMAIVLLGVYV